MYKETHYCRVTLKLIYLYWKSRRLGFCGRNPNAPLALHFTTLSPKYLKLNKKLPTSRGKKKRNLPSILSKWTVHFLLLTKNYPRILNPISEKHFHVSSTIFHIIFISYLWPQKRIHKPCSLSWKKKTKRKKTEIISIILHVQRSPCLHYHGCVHSKFSHENNLCIQVSSLGHSHRKSGPWIKPSTTSSPTPNNGFFFQLFSGHSDQNSPIMLMFEPFSTYYYQSSMNILPTKSRNLF